jgi:hypothetical protein
MKITRDNYEIWFVDYLEGNLEESLVNEFIDFLQRNPDLKAELELARPAETEPDDVLFPGKEKLYKEKYDLEEEFNRTAVARLEGDLTKAGKADFEKYLSRHPEKQREAARFEQTRLKPEVTIVFRRKRKLYRYSAGRTIMLWSTRIAAVLLLAFLAYKFAGNFGSEKIIPENQLAVTETEPETAVPVTTTPKKNTGNEDQLLPAKETGIAKPIKEQTANVPVDFQRENHTKPASEEGIAQVRISVEAPEELTGRTASLTVQPPKPALAQINKIQPREPEKNDEERLLAEIVKDKTGLNNLSLAKVAKAGLNLVSSVSKEKFTYQTNSDGEITELAYDSRLLAFSIPTKND